MVKVASLFSQVLAQVPRFEFDALAHEHGVDRYAKGFRTWTQLVAMLFSHLGRAESLREICHGLTGCLGRLVHLGVRKAPVKSTLAYANEHRPAGFFEALFFLMLGRFRTDRKLGPCRKAFRFKNKLRSLDSTTISLCLSLFPWAEFRRKKGGVKLHVLLDHDDYMPTYLVISEAKRHDRKFIPFDRLQPGSILVYDKAYNDYRGFSRLTESGAYFVTRMKDNARYRVVEERTLPKHRNILADEIIELTGMRASQKCPHRLRRVVVWIAEKGESIVLLTNHMDFGSTTIAAIYKDRWKIELFFKTIKQNLKVKTFIGTSENALRIQIWTAMIALLLLRWLHHLSKANWSFSNMAAQLRFNLFTYRSLLEWLADPLGCPPITPEVPSVQLMLDLGQAAA